MYNKKKCEEKGDECKKNTSEQLDTKQSNDSLILNCEQQLESR